MTDYKSAKHIVEDDFKDMTDEEKDKQAMLWSVLFIISDFAVSTRTIFEALVEKGVFTKEEYNEVLGTMTRSMHAAGYNEIENLFRSKFDRIRAGMNDPEMVIREAKEKSDG